MRSIILKGNTLGRLGAVSLAMAMMACSGTSSKQSSASRTGGVYEDTIQGITQESLTPLGTAPTFDNVTGAMVVTVAPGELAMISLGPIGSGAKPVLVNGVQPNDATPVTGGVATDASLISVMIQEAGTGTAGTTEVILDYTNGVFASALSSGGSVTFDLAGTEATILGIKGQSGADHIVFGANGINVSNPVNTNAPDVIWGSTAGAGFNGGAGTFIVSMGDGNDYFSAGGDPTGTSPAVLGGVFDNTTPKTGTAAPNYPKGVMIFGGAGNDTFDQGDTPTTYETISGGGDTGDVVDYSSRTAAVNVSLGILGIASTGLSGHCPSTGSSGSCTTDEFDDISTDVAIVNGGSGNDYFTAFAVAVAGGSSDGGTDAGSDARVDATDARVDATDARSDVADARVDSASDAGDGGAAAPGPGPQFNGGAGNDTFTPYGGTYVMSGGAGDDTFLMGDQTKLHGPGVVIGGSGVDTIDFSLRTSSLHVTLDAALTTPFAGTLSGTYSGSTAVESMKVGQDLENIKGGSGNDVLTGNALDNVITGGLGSDVITGGGGNDTADYSERTGAIWVALDGVAHSGASSHMTKVTGTAGQNYTDGSCTLVTGTGLNNTGSDENDTVALDVRNILGGSGADCLLGQPVGSSCSNSVCQNTLVGGAGSDMLFGFDDDDLVDGSDSATANYLDCGAGSGDISRNPGTGGYRALTCEF